MNVFRRPVRAECWSYQNWIGGAGWAKELVAFSAPVEVMATLWACAFVWRWNASCMHVCMYVLEPHPAIAPYERDMRGVCWNSAVTTLLADPGPVRFRWHPKHTTNPVHFSTLAENIFRWQGNRISHASTNESAMNAGMPNYNFVHTQRIRLKTLLWEQWIRTLPSARSCVAQQVLEL